MAGIFGEESDLQKKLKEHLNLKECKLEDGSIVSNIDGICQVLIEKALNGDMGIIQVIDSILAGRAIK